jgi:SAM-dependent methyltransferase
VLALERETPLVEDSAMNDLVGSNEMLGKMRSLSVFNLWISRMIYVAAKLGIADLLHEGPRSSEDLAAAVGANADALHRVLRALAWAGVFEALPEKRFALNPLAASLRTGVPGSMRALVLLFCGDLYAGAWADLLSSVTSGKTAVEHRTGAPLYPYLTTHPEDARLFDEAMTSLTAVENAAVVARYDFSAFRTVVDVGGGHGSLLAAILAQSPEMRGVLFDQPHIIEASKARAPQGPLGGRAELVAGNFFEAVPSGADAYALRHIVCNWDDAAATRILRTCHRAMKPGGRVLVIESVVSRSEVAELLDVHLLTVVGGRMRTEQEHRALLESAGFAMTRVVPTDVGLQLVVIEGTRES